MHTRLSLSFKSPVASFSYYYVIEFYQQHAISRVVSGENQAYLAVTGVTGYDPY